MASQHSIYNETKQYSLKNVSLINKLVNNQLLLKVAIITLKINLSYIYLLSSRASAMFFVSANKINKCTKHTTQTLSLNIFTLKVIICDIVYT